MQSHETLTTADFDFAHWRQSRLSMVESALERWVGVGVPAPLAEPMRYAVLGGGKRLRALLVLAAAEAVAGDLSLALRAACAVELIHAYSLVHDDMPCMDNDVLRRGKATVHVAYGQASALLAGDALQALAFELLTPEAGECSPPSGLAGVVPQMQAHLCRLLARAAGGCGMAGGQAIDLASVGRQLGADALRNMHRLKTGALLQASVLMGAACSGAPQLPVAALARYGEAIGLAFQVMDDVLDVTADSATLGKTAGKDEAQDKPTYVTLLGLQAARDHAQHLLEQALAALQSADLSEAAALQALAQAMVARAH
jgi:farnesyl diphosphate synthase